MNTREAGAAEGLSRLGIATFIDFLRSARDDDCIAVRIAIERVTAGEPVEQIFFTGSEYGFHLKVEQVSARLLHVAFGCLADGRAGDGGSWDVVLDAQGALFTTTITDSWTA